MNSKNTSGTSKKSNTITRSLAKVNPSLNKEVLENYNLADNITKRSNKTPRTPPKKTFNDNLQEGLQNQEIIHKETNRTETDNQKETYTRGNIRDFLNKLSPLKALEKNKNQSQINETFETDEHTETDKQEYSDIGGILNEQSLLLNYQNHNTTLEEALFNNQEYDNTYSEKVNTEISDSEIINNETSGETSINDKNLLDLPNPEIQNFNDSLYKIVPVTSNKSSQTNQEETKMAQKMSVKDVAKMLPGYDGKNVSATEYINKLKRAKSLLKKEEEKILIDCLKFKFTGQAESVLGNLNANTIDELIKAIRTVFPSEGNVHSLLGELSQVYQKNDESVIEYFTRLKNIVIEIKEIKQYELLNDAAGIETYIKSLDADAKKYFRDGLKFEIKMELKNNNSLEEMSAEAIAIENNLKKRRKNQGLNSINTIQFEHEKNISSIENNILLCQICKNQQHEALFCNEAACVYCKSIDHFSNSCRVTRNKIKLICRNCSQPGHSISTCSFNNSNYIYCQYCQEKNHEVGQCPFIKEYEMCWKCKESGHNPNFCPNKRDKPQYCENCGIFGHNTQNCVENFCQKCMQLGYPCVYCKGKASGYKICSICKNNTHDTDECNQVKLLIAQNKNKAQLQCQVCDGIGHTAKNCYKLKNLQRPQEANTNNCSNFSSYNRNKQFGNFSFNKPQFKTNTNFRNNGNQFNMRRNCEYCNNVGHTIQECRKMQALQKYNLDGARKQCSFCSSVGHSINECIKLKELERGVDKFCNTCKTIGHTEDTCFKNLNSRQNYVNQQGNSGNGQTLPGESAQEE